MKNKEQDEIINIIYELLLSKKYNKRGYIKFLIWKKIIYFHYPHLITTDYFLKKVFDSMIKEKLFLSKKVKCRDQYKLNDFCIEENRDLGYISF